MTYRTGGVIMPCSCFVAENEYPGNTIRDGIMCQHSERRSNQVDPANLQDGDRFQGFHQLKKNISFGITGELPERTHYKEPVFNDNI